MKKIVISTCPYCKSQNLALGFQNDKGSVYADIRGGVFGSQIEHIICKDCGSIVYSRVIKPDMFKEKENTADLEISVEEIISDLSLQEKAVLEKTFIESDGADVESDAVDEPVVKRPVTAKPMIFTKNNDE